MVVMVVTREQGGRSAGLSPCLSVTPRCLVFQMWTSVWASSTTVAAGQLASTRAEAFSVSVRSVPVLMATPATSKHLLCKWAHSSETLPSQAFGRCDTTGRNKPDSRLSGPNRNRPFQRPSAAYITQNTEALMSSWQTFWLVSEIRKKNIKMWW